MSSVNTPSAALEFTNDNKHAYAFSGPYQADSASHKVISFKTESYYLKATITVNGAVNPLTSSVANTNGQIKLNDITIGVAPMSTALDNNYNYREFLIIPPFTQCDVYINFHETDSNDIATALVMAEVGMPQRVGNE
tara:strand:+ start:90 stop:500 length:411 start_codon:yes stop_codon:yes gene_type:complete